MDSLQPCEVKGTSTSEFNTQDNAMQDHRTDEIISTRTHLSVAKSREVSTSKAVTSLSRSVEFENTSRALGEGLLEFRKKMLSLLRVLTFPRGMWMKLERDGSELDEWARELQSASRKLVRRAERGSEQLPSSTILRYTEEARMVGESMKRLLGGMGDLAEAGGALNRDVEKLTMVVESFNERVRTLCFVLAKCV